MTTDGWGDASGWRVRFANLDALPADSDKVARQRRGTAFEQVLYAMLESAGMKPRTRFRPTGEEIDGSFMHHGRPMLLEAKWTSGPIPASVLYQFRGKVEGKLVGTLGMFISMGGYADDAVDALVAGKSLNLILFDGEDMRKLADKDGMGIANAIDLKLRAAAEEGTPYVPLPEPARQHRPPGAYARQNPVFVVEGNYDVQIIQALLQSTGSKATPTILAANGRMNLPLVALSQLSLQPDTRRLIILADGDGAPTDVRSQIEETFTRAATPSGLEVAVVVVEPNLESALGLLETPGSRRPSPSALSQAIQGLDIAELASANVDLALLFQYMGLSAEDSGAGRIEE